MSESRENMMAIDAITTGQVLTGNIDRTTEVIKGRHEAIDMANRNAKKVQELEQQVDYYRQLLSKPFAEIASKHQKFKETYEAQQEFIADWMVSQKAFKEIAIKYGRDAGKSKEEIIQEGLKTERNVLESTTEFDNNASDSSIIRRHVEKLKEKLNK